MINGVSAKSFVNTCIQRPTVSIPSIKNVKNHIISPHKTNPESVAKNTTKVMDSLFSEKTRNSKLYKFFKSFLQDISKLQLKHESGGGCN